MCYQGKNGGNSAILGILKRASVWGHVMKLFFVLFFQEYFEMFPVENTNGSSLMNSNLSTLKIIAHKVY